MIKKSNVRGWNLQTLKWMAMITIILGLVFAVGCASSSKTKREATTPTPPPKETLAPTPTPAPPPEEVAKKETPKEETISGDEAAKQPKTESIAEISSVYFEFDKYDLGSDARATLSKNAQWLKGNTDIKIRVEGNCDERGTVEYNLALGEKRANAVKDYYISLGIPASRIQSVSYGKERPKDPGHSEDAWAKNRRSDTVKILP